MVLEEAERAEFRRHARQEGQSLSAWLKEAGRARIADKKSKPGFADQADLSAFFRRCDELAGDGIEPDWAEQRQLIDAAKRSGLPNS